MHTETAQSLEKAFAVFQQQSERLERTHLELQHKLETTQLSLEKKNIELAQRIDETEGIKSNLLGILESINDAVFLLSPTFSIKVANRAATELMEKIGEKELFLLPQIRATIQSEKQTKDHDIEIVICGEECVFQLSIIHTSEHSPDTDTVISLKDVTEQRKLQKVAARNDRMAALGQVTASVAHEIRNPLAAIEGFATLLTRDLANDPAALRLASKTVYAARQLNSVVSNMLTHTRDVVVHTAPQDINRSIHEALELVSPQAKDKKIAVELQLSETPAIAEIDLVQFNQVVINLITNALEACPFDRPGKILIKTYTTKHFVCLEIVDNGDGITLSNKQKIFDPFYSKKDGGVGLGLSLCRRIIDAHHGTIFENGIENEGACFTVKLNKLEKES